VSSTEVNITSVGWTPTNSATDTRTKAHKSMTATLTLIKFVGKVPPAPLAVHGTVDTRGNITVTSENDQVSCGHLPAVYSTGSQNITDDGTGDIQGNPGQTASVATSTYESFTLTNADLDLMKSLAKTSGTYLQGNQTFSAANPIPANGLVFIDTVSGVNPPCTSPCVAASDIATVTIGANAGPGGSTFTGMLIVNGGLVLTGATTFNAMLYAHDKLSVTGAITVNGAVMTRNIINAQPSKTFDTSGGITPTINWNCANAKGGGLVSQGWFVKAASYREPSE
jgi:hypothetical protein